MMFALTIRSAVCLTLGLALAGCGDDEKDSAGGGGSSEVNSGVTQSKPLSQVTEAEAQQLQEGYEKAMQSSKVADAMCGFSAVLASAFQEGFGGGGGTSCEDLFAACKQGFKDNPAQASATSGAASLGGSATYATCNVTVGELEACLTASLDAMATAFSSFKCGSEPGDVTAAPSTATLSACEKVNTECPAVVAQDEATDEL